MTNTNQVPYRIITHGGCTDGFFSAWLCKRYFNELTDLNFTRIEIDQIPVLGFKPGEIQVGEIELKENDILLDLPLPENTEVFLWIDHHSSSKPKRELNNYEHWYLEPSCSGLILSLLEKKGIKLSQELNNFKNAIDKIDSANYTKEEILKTYYPPKEGDEFDTQDPLLTTHILSSFIHTKDPLLNDTLLANLSKSSPKADSPLTDPYLWNMSPILFYHSRLKSFNEWREQVDTYIEYDKEHKTIVQDDRKIRRIHGTVDRFYGYVKFPEASYGLVIKEKEDDKAFIGVGCNIFHKDWCKVDIGKLCKKVATKFGFGGGGGHKTVGGCMIKFENIDQAKEIFLTEFKNSE